MSPPISWCLYNSIFISKGRSSRNVSSSTVVWVCEIDGEDLFLLVQRSEGHWIWGEAEEDFANRIALASILVIKNNENMKGLISSLIL
jgi:hypothetical protein